MVPLHCLESSKFFFLSYSSLILTLSHVIVSIIGTVLATLPSGWSEVLAILHLGWNSAQGPCREEALQPNLVSHEEWHTACTRFGKAKRLGTDFTTPKQAAEEIAERFPHICESSQKSNDQGKGFNCFVSSNCHRVFILDAYPDYVFRMGVTQYNDMVLMRNYQCVVEALSEAMHEYGRPDIRTSPFRLLMMKIDGQLRAVVVEKKEEMEHDAELLGKAITAAQHHSEEYARILQELTLLIIHTGLDDITPSNTPLTCDASGNMHITLLDLEIPRYTTDDMNVKSGLLGMMRYYCGSKAHLNTIELTLQKHGYDKWNSKLKDERELRKKDLEEEDKLQQFYAPLGPISGGEQLPPLDEQALGNHLDMDKTTTIYVEPEEGKYEERTFTMLEAAQTVHAALVKGVTANSKAQTYERLFHVDLDLSTYSPFFHFRLWGVDEGHTEEEGRWLKEILEAFCKTEVIFNYSNDAFPETLTLECPWLSGTCRQHYCRPPIRLGHWHVQCRGVRSSS